MKTQSQRKLVPIEGTQTSEPFSVNQPEMIIDRDQGSDILIDSPGVSRRHGWLRIQGDDLILEDLGSSNGTYVNSERIISARKLKNGDEIRLGRAVSLLFQDIPSVAATRLESSPVKPDLTVAEIEQPPGMIIQPYEATMLGEDYKAQPRQATPPQLIVSVAGGEVQTFPLTEPRLNLGRSEDNQIIIDSRIISRHHAYLEKIPTRPGGSPGQDYRLVLLAEASNPILLAGRPIVGQHELHHGDILRVGSLDPGLMVTMTYVNPAQGESTQGTGQSNLIRFGEKSQVQIGRDASNDVILDSPTVSRFHAQIERIGHRHRLVDLRSANGTFILGRDEAVLAAAAIATLLLIHERRVMRVICDALLS